MSTKTDMNNLINEKNVEKPTKTSKNLSGLQKTLLFLLIYVLSMGLIVGFFLSKKDPLSTFIRSRDCTFFVMGDFSVAKCTDGTQWNVTPYNKEQGAVEIAPIEPVVYDIPAQESGNIGLTMTIKYSRYDPSLLGTNCAEEANGFCISPTASGKAWQPLMEIACACPPQWAFGTKVILDGKEWICEDRGGAIIFDYNGYTYVDFMTQYPTHKYNELVDVVVIFP